MTDNEIIKALEYCYTNDSDDCYKCPYKNESTAEMFCDKKLTKDALDLINRQKSEIERLKQNLEEAHIDIREHLAENKRLTADLKTTENVIKNTFLEKAGFDIDPLAEIKTEAYKEFAERLKKEMVYEHFFETEVVVLDKIKLDNLLKEMVGAEE